VHVHRNYIVTSDAGALPSPQAYLVEQEPNDALRTHFHYNSQFQIFVSGSGTLGRHEVRPYLVQYADRQTGYGPIQAGPQGLEYLTLRPTTIAKRAQYLPEGRDLVDRSVPKRQAASIPMEVCSGGYSERIMIEPTADGLAAWMLHLPPDSCADGPTLPGGSGRFYVIVGGALQTVVGELPGLSVAWVSAEDDSFELRTGVGGADVIVVQFPANAWRDVPDV
jgi:hypothetical protein